MNSEITHYQKINSKQKTAPNQALSVHFREPTLQRTGSFANEPSVLHGWDGSITGRLSLWPPPVRGDTPRASPPSRLSGGSCCDDSAWLRRAGATLKSVSVRAATIALEASGEAQTEAEQRLLITLTFIITIIVHHRRRLSAPSLTEATSSHPWWLLLGTCAEGEIVSVC